MNIAELECLNILYPGADQFLSDRRGADFPRGVHLCATKGAAWAAVFLASLS